MTDQAANLPISKAAVWLATTSQHQRPEHLIPHLRETFGLTNAEAIEAIRENHLIKVRAH
jgi:hypothetical protein